MRIILTFSILILVLCAGCPQTIPQPNDGLSEETIGTPDFNVPEPLVEPLVPRKRLPEEAAEGESDIPETTGVVSDALGRYAAKVVPLPPIEDMVAQIDAFITRMGQSLDSLDGSPRYAADAGDIVRDANALALIALAIGMSEMDSKYKKSASHIIEAAKKFAIATTLEEGQKAYEALKVSLTNTETGKPLSWSDRVADLGPAMKALPNLSSALKRVTDTETRLNTNLDRRPQQIFSQLAAMAVISQGSIPNVTETEKTDAVEEWKRYCEEFRDVAIRANVAARRYAQERADGKEPDYALFRTAFLAMIESCDDCHRAFYPNAVGM